jgi:signal transduction histidine kinase
MTVRSKPPPSQETHAERATFEEVARQRIELSKNKALLAALEAVPGFALLLNRQRQVLLANHRFLRAFLLDDSEYLGTLRPGEIVGCPHAREQQVGCGTTPSCMDCAGLDCILQSFETGELIEGKGNLNTRDGRFPIDISASPIMVEESNCLLVTIRVTPDSGNSNDLKSVTDAQLGDASRLSALGTMVGGIAHEINNPLMIIQTAIENIRHSIPEMPIVAANSLEKITTAAQKISNTIQQMKEFNLPPSSTTTPFDIHEVLQGALAIVEPHLRHSLITVEKQIPCETIVLQGCAKQFQQLLCAILLNSRDALTATKTGHIITIGVKEEGANVLVTIGDNGCGIIPEHLSQIFKPFFTTKKPGKGLGLGLTFARKVVDTMKGTIEVTSEIDRGTVVTMRFHKPKMGSESPTEKIETT